MIDNTHDTVENNIVGLADIFFGRGDNLLGSAVEFILEGDVTTTSNVGVTMMSVHERGLGGECRDDWKEEEEMELHDGNDVMCGRDRSSGKIMR
jgi:hypothetical protein